MTCRSHRLAHRVASLVAALCLAAPWLCPAAAQEAGSGSAGDGAPAAPPRPAAPSDTGSATVAPDVDSAAVAGVRRALGPGAAQDPLLPPVRPADVRSGIRRDSAIDAAVDLDARPRRGLLRPADLAPAGAFLGALALAGSAPGLERSVREDAYHGGGGPDRALYEAGHLAGDGWVDLGVSGAAWLAGGLAGSEETARVGRRALEATLASTAVAAVMKMGFGRARPAASGDPRDFRPGTLDSERYAFPSGHTAHAFALAATLDRELDGGWVPWVAYPLATGVGASRVVGRRHWVTDVIAGAAVGVLTSRVLGRLHGPAGAAGTGGDPGVRPRIAVGSSGSASLGLTVPVSF